MRHQARRIRRGVSELAVVAVCAALPAAAQAQSQTAQAQTSEQNRALAQATAQSTITLDTLVIGATKTEEKAIDSLAGVSVVGEQQLQQLMPARPSDIFFGMPSVWFQDRGDSPESSINIRGLQDFGRVAVLIDGARQNFQRSGHNASGTFFLEPELLAGLEIVRGPVANIYGSGAIGGVASFRTKDVDDILRPGERWGSQNHAMGMSNTAQILASTFFGARINPNLDVFAGGTYRDRSNFKDGYGDIVPNTAYDVTTGIAKVTARPWDGHEVKLTGITYESGYQTGQQAQAQESVYGTNVTNNIATARWKYFRPDDRLLNFDANVYFTNTKQDQTKIANGTLTSLGNPISGFVGDKRSFSIETVGFDVNNTSRFDFGPFRNALTLGGDGFRDTVDNSDPTGNGAILTPNGERTVSGAFAQLRTNYSSWLEVIGAVRYDTYELQSPTDNANGDHVSPKITVGITPFQGFTVYGTHAQGYRAPAVTETLVSGAHPPFAAGFPDLFTFVPNPQLKPEIGTTKEVGINLKYDNILTAGDAFRGKINYFQNDVSDYIELVTFGPPITACPPGAPVFLCNLGIIPLIVVNTYSLAQYQNIGDARIKGTEFDLNYDAGSWFVGVSGQRIRGTDETNGQPLITVQPDQVATTFGVRLYDRKLTAAIRWAAVASKSADQIPDRDNDGIPDLLPTASYNLVNFYLGYTPSDNVTASFGIENLLNEYYIPYLAGTPNTTAGNGFVFPGPGITYKAGLQVRFGAM
jgi:hemoglobin/transferrin/lactoferrin receptor protein